MTIHAVDPGWNTSCPNWVERIKTGRSLVPDLPLFKDEADRALDLFKSLRVPDLPGTPTYGEVSGQWVFDFVRAIFGSYNRATRRRLIREFFLLVPKKNGKSALSAAIMVVAAVLADRPESELLLIAPSKGIADIVFKQIKGIIRLDPVLVQMFHIRDHLRQIVRRLNNVTIAVKAADTDAITGGKSAFTLIDETHVFAEHARAKDVFLELRGALASRPEGFLLQITTQSKREPRGVFKAELDEARAVRDGLVRRPVLAVLYELPPELQREDGWMNEAVWPLVNPNLGRSVDLAFLRDEVDKAKREGPEQLALIASQHFNVQAGIGFGGWTAARFWAAAADPQKITLDSLLERCEVLVIGLDGGGLDDMLGLCAAGRCRETGDRLYWHRAWIHPEAVAARKGNEPIYQDFIADGDLVLVTRPGQDLDEMAEIIGRASDAGLLPDENAVGVDRAGLGGGMIADLLMASGISEKQITAIPQGYRLTGAIAGVERQLKDGTMWHDGSAMMAWCVGNAKPEVKGNGIYITKEVAGRAKIDPLIALFNAAALLDRRPVAAFTTAPSPWDDPKFSLSGAVA